MGLVILRGLKQSGITQKNLITLGAGSAVFITGLVLQLAAGHGPFRARSWGTFLDALTGNLAWPFRDQPVMLCLPSWKNLTATARQVQPPGLDHYECYAVTNSANIPPAPHPVLLHDQFNTATGRTKVVPRPNSAVATLVCTANS